ncbi:helix-turn-helix domain-containing protein [Amycolatopsis rhabdoformis]|uniref:Helix-turn-helix domain-containing protein n=1 Tax=Amycolatopsis rhabdoformis TaxID=1448059 RepID=A0ABZ1I2N1_9PSEU|nr:helix-turn-helix domain-containing protein [Amycolatopsis rhabdoformis]WSE27910.1 helix-turn-helix domain-containing protein [Amycolatopsis rhabdoformis]
MATADDITQLATTLAQLAERLAAQEADTAARPVPRSMPARVLLTVEEAAERLGIGRTMTYRLVRTGQLESVQIGRLRRIHVSAVDEYAMTLVTASARHAA